MFKNANRLSVAGFRIFVAWNLKSEMGGLSDQNIELSYKISKWIYLVFKWFYEFYIDTR